MVEAWAFQASPPVGAGASANVTLVRGTTFCISDSTGDVHTGTEQGFFSRDTRLLSRFTLRLDQHSPEPLSTQRKDPYSCTFISRRRPKPGSADSTLLVVRDRRLTTGMRERITLRNLGEEATAVSLTLHVEADFADLFEVKENRPATRDLVSLHVGDESLEFSGTEASHQAGVRVTASLAHAVDPGALTWHVVVPPRGSWSTCVRVSPVVDGTAVDEDRGCAEADDGPHGQWYASWNGGPRSH